MVLLTKFLFSVNFILFKFAFLFLFSGACSAFVSLLPNKLALFFVFLIYNAFELLSFSFEDVIFISWGNLS